MRALLKDPLLHFLAAGLVIFIVGDALKPPEANARRIVVDRAALLEFIQFRSKAFEPRAAEALLDSITGEARQRLIRDYVEEEALYREAKALGLETDDYVIKQRLVQKLDFIAGAANETPASEEEIAVWFDSHRDDYAAPPTATFAHVFFTNERRGAAAAQALAASAARDLKASTAGFEGALGKGERFPFHTNYVERTYDYVESQFGEAAARDIFSDEGPFGEWRGPVMSPYGAHAIFVREVTPRHYPDLADVKNRVAEDASRDRASRAKEKIVADLISEYDIVIDPGVSAAATPLAP